MVRLAIDSSAEETLLATEVIKGGNKKVVTSRVDKAENVANVLEKHLISISLSVDDINEILIGIGPGRFTGLRVTLSYAKALAYGLGINLCAFSLLDAIRLAFRDSSKSIEKSPVCCFLDGKQKIVFASFSWGDSICIEVVHLESWLSEFKKKYRHAYFVAFGTFDREIQEKLVSGVESINKTRLIHWREIDSIQSAFNLPKSSYVLYQGRAIFNLSPNYLRSIV